MKPEEIAKLVSDIEDLLAPAILSAVHKAEARGRLAGLQEAYAALNDFYAKTSDPTYHDAAVRIQNLIDKE